MKFCYNTGFQAPFHEKLWLKLGLFSQKFRAFVNEQEGHDGPGSLTWVSLESNYFKICPPV